jgi:hypothetical protein
MHTCTLKFIIYHILLNWEEREKRERERERKKKIIRCSSCSSKSEEHLIGPSMSVCHVFPRD